MNRDRDFALALKLQQQYDEELSFSRKKKSFMDIPEDPKVSIIDPTLEFTDPTPDIHKMFVGFDKKFFWSSLGSVEVMWSPRMTQCAGICRYRGHRGGNGATTIHLSLPLLKLRPRKDLVETLLHEMIHAYLFVTRNNKDRDGHGPEFHSHMHRINKSAGTNITVYHSFHNEVSVYKTHWWRCNGPCQHQKPFYGLVKRSMNRAPGPYDFWFADHQQKCGGQFIKIKEPENYKSRKRNKETGNEKGKTATSKGKKMPEFFKPSGSNTAIPKGGMRMATGGSSTRTIMSVSKIPKDDDGSNHGQQIKTSPPRSNIVPFSGQGHMLGKSAAPIGDKPWLKRFDNDLSSSTGRSHVQNSVGSSKKIGDKPPSNHFNKFPRPSPVKSPIKIASSSNKKIGDKPSSKLFNKVPSPVKSPIKNSGVSNNKIDNYFSSQPSISKKPKMSTPMADEVPPDTNHIGESLYKVSCPVCNKSVDASVVNDHLDECLKSSGEKETQTGDSQCVMCSQKFFKRNDESVLCSACELGACSSDFEAPTQESDDRCITCPMCEEKMSSGDLERHLESCIEDACSDKNTTRFVDDDEDDEIFVEWVKISKNESGKS